MTTRTAATLASEAFRHLPVPRTSTVRPVRAFVTARSRAYRCASPGARLSAATIDVLLFLAIGPALLGLAAVVLRELWWVAGVGGAVCYLVSGWAEGGTPGMRAARVRLAACYDGRSPGWRKAAVRSLLVLPPVCAAFILADAAVEGGPNHPAAEPSVLVTAMALVALGALDYAWILVNGHRRALHDILSRTVMVSARPETLKSPRPVHGADRVPAGQG